MVNRTIVGGAKIDNSAGIHAKAEIMERLQMEEEEVNRLAETRTAPERNGQDSFGRGWVPDTREKTKPVIKKR